MKGINKRFLFTAIIILSAITGALYGQPQPGDVYKEYIWTTINVQGKEKHFRVGGKLDYRNTPENFNELIDKDGWIRFPYILNLKNAVRAEIQIEKNLCHEGTRGLSINFNENGWFRFPESDSIPYPQWNYLHHTYPVAEIPLNSLKKSGNLFMLQVDSIQEWNWPQNLVYGLILRIYYDKSIGPPDVRWITPRARSTISGNVVFEIKEGDIRIYNVDFIGNYEDINYEGDGIYHRWHYHYYYGKIMHNIGSVSEPPFKVTWNTDWIPDQEHPITIGAVVSFDDDYKFFMRPLRDLRLERDYHVMLIKPFDQPENWTTRADHFSEKIFINRDPVEAMACQLVWTSWSPCYGNGLYVNDYVVFTREGPCYDYFFHRVDVRNPEFLKKGENIITTGKTPLDHTGNMVHGMDIQWPGIMVLIQYKK